MRTKIRMNAVQKSLVCRAIRAYCQSDNIPRCDYASTVTKIKFGRYAAMNEGEWFLVFDALGCNDADLDLSRLYETGIIGESAKIWHDAVRRVRGF